MNKIKIMFAAIIAVAMIAGVAAFKINKSQYCVYQTTTITTIPGGPKVTCCRTLGNFDITIAPNGALRSSVFTTEDNCAQLPTKTATANCSLTLRLTLE